jgi:hypothetical protein
MRCSSIQKGNRQAHVSFLSFESRGPRFNEKLRDPSAQTDRPDIARSVWNYLGFVTTLTAQLRDSKVAGQGSEALHIFTSFSA